MNHADRFKGAWRLSRDIYDIDSEWLGRFLGQATFTQDGDALAYFEEGKLQFGGLTAMTATRVYRWEFAGDIVLVKFEDGRSFHSFDASAGRPQASHYCDPDDYDVTYDFRNWPKWRAEWRVEGPRKNYRMVSRYCRAGRS